MSKNNQISSYLKDELERKGVSQKQMQQDLGVSQQYISALINGTKSIGKNMAKKLNSLYDLDEVLLLGLSEIQQPSTTDNEIKNKPHDEQMQILYDEISVLKEEINNIRIRDGLYLEAIAAKLGIDVESNSSENIEKEKSGTN